MKKEKAEKVTDTYSVIIKYKDSSNREAVQFFMDNFEKMFKQEFKEFGSVTVIKELDLHTWTICSIIRSSNGSTSNGWAFLHFNH